MRAALNTIYPIEITPCLNRFHYLCHTKFFTMRVGTFPPWRHPSTGYPQGFHRLRVVYDIISYFLFILFVFCSLV